VTICVRGGLHSVFSVFRVLDFCGTSSSYFFTLIHFIQIFSNPVNDIERVTVTKTRVWIGNWIYWILTGLNIIADLHNFQSLHTNLLSLSALVFTG
jgi:hypothetical protein